ncbi:hypothetical protein EH243_17660 [Amphritea opalescens]|uniref:Uncharacterized protein n=1 Tax=Amphritea opalescens TaxID=2490544 RepID=A0A430KLP3_9GAMM|nr:hypothetical protein [Amphritea opalescens]RTE64395.1 hypothetical protein EH243_17660 [Amphritea opalescens]
MGIDEIATIFRGFERLIIIGAAILALYFGYKLFIAGIDSEQSGEFSGKSFTIKLIKVGPGIFFALFSTSVLITMTWQNVQFSENSKSPSAPDILGSRLTSFFGAEDSSHLKRQLELASQMKSRFQAGQIPKEVFLSSVSSLQKVAAKIYVGKEVYEKCEFFPEKPVTNDCRIYMELIK